MALGWKTLLPLAVFNFVVVAVWILATRIYGPGGGWLAVGACLLALATLYMYLLVALRGKRTRLQKRKATLVHVPASLGALQRDGTGGAAS
jgi:4-hydroxybenzoate polyprenyltransferase